MSRLPVNMRIKPGDVADLVIAAGDPARVEQVAGLLDDVRVVNHARGFLTYTGRYKGKEVSVSCHGVGGPSSAIVFEELAMVGAKTIVRLGTCGAMIEELNIGDVVIPVAAAYNDGGLRMYVPDGILPPVPDLELTYRIVDGFKGSGIKHVIGLVFSSDAFYAEDPEFVRKWRKRGVIAVEMECATLFTLGLLRSWRTAAALVVSDSLVKEEQKEMATAEQLRDRVEEVAKTLLDILISLQ